MGQGGFEGGSVPRCAEKCIPPVGLEPTTNRSKVHRSIQLSYEGWDATWTEHSYLTAPPPRERATVGQGGFEGGSGPRCAEKMHTPGGT